MNEEPDEERTEPIPEECFTVAAASAKLGVSPRAVRARITRGTLHAECLDVPGGRTYRIPASALGDRGAAPHSDGETGNGTGERTGVPHTGVPRLEAITVNVEDEEASDKDWRIWELTGQVEWLRRQVEKQTEQSTRLALLLEREQNRNGSLTLDVPPFVKALPVPADARRGAPAPEITPPVATRAWWQFWRKG